MNAKLAREIALVYSTDALELLYQFPPTDAARDEGNRLDEVAGEWHQIADRLRGADRCYCGRALAELPVDRWYESETDDGTPVLALFVTCPCAGYSHSRIAPHPVVAAALARLR